MNDNLLIKQYEMLPDSLKKEVLDIVAFLLHKYQHKTEIKSKKKPKFGSSRGMFIIAEDFQYHFSYRQHMVLL